MASPFNLQVAFQGGGAKIALLLAAAEVMQELSEGKSPLIKVTKVAGTSAGAIVGALLAAGCSIAAARKSLAGEDGQKLLEKFVLPSDFKTAAWKFWKNDYEPIWSDEPLREWLRKQLRKSRHCKGTSLPTFEDLGFAVVSSDLVNGKPYEYQAHDDVVEAVLDSMALPIFFRTWKKEGADLRVDGGLCENLPIERLQIEDEVNGPVIAFSFDDDKPSRPDDFLGFLLSLFNASIAHSVRSARKRLVDDAVFRLASDPAIQTLDFVPALKWLQGKGYEQLKKSVREWLTRYVDNHSYGPSQQIVGDLWRRPSAGAMRDHMRRIGRLYHETHEHVPINFHRVELFVTAYSLTAEGNLNHGKPDEVAYEIEIGAVNEPVYAHRLSLSNPTTLAFFGHYELEVEDADGRPVEFEAFGSVSPKRDAAADRQMVVFFKRPLQPGRGTYIVRLKDTGMDLLQPLLDNAKDRVDVWLGRAEGEVGTVLVGLHVPRGYEDIEMVGGESSAGFSVVKTNRDRPFKFVTVAWKVSKPVQNWKTEPVRLVFSRST